MKLAVFFAVLCVAVLIGVNAYGPEEKCPEDCKKDHEPVCCVYADGEATTFHNSCEAEMINCKAGKKCVEEAKGECHHHGYGHDPEHGHEHH